MYRILFFKTSAARLDEIRVGYFFFKASAACWHAGGGRAEDGVEVEGGAGVRGAPLVGSRGEVPTGVHETNLKCFMNKLCHEIRQLDEQFVHLLVSWPGFCRQECVADDSTRLCVQFLYD